MKRTALRSRPTRHCASCAAAGRTLCIHGKGPERRAMKRKPKSPEKWASQYGSEAYLEHLASMPCAVCGVTGWTEAAHTETGGTGMKAGPETLAPLCGDRLDITGCHTLLDDFPWELAEGTERRLRALAKELWKRWTERKGRDD